MSCFVVFIHVRGMWLVEYGNCCCSAAGMCWVRFGQIVGLLSCLSAGGMPSLPRAVLPGTCFRYGSLFVGFGREGVLHKLTYKLGWRSYSNIELSCSVHIRRCRLDFVSLLVSFV